MAVVWTTVGDIAVHWRVPVGSPEEASLLQIAGKEVQSIHFMGQHVFESDELPSGFAESSISADSAVDDVSSHLETLLALFGGLREYKRTEREQEKAKRHTEEHQIVVALLAFSALCRRTVVVSAKPKVRAAAVWAFAAVVRQFSAEISDSSSRDDFDCVVSSIHRVLKSWIDVVRSFAIDASELPGGAHDVNLRAASVSLCGYFLTFFFQNIVDSEMTPVASNPVALSAHVLRSCLSLVLAGFADRMEVVRHVACDILTNEHLASSVLRHIRDVAEAAAKHAVSNAETSSDIVTVAGACRFCAAVAESRFCTLYDSVVTVLFARGPRSFQGGPDTAFPSHQNFTLVRRLWEAARVALWARPADLHDVFIARFNKKEPSENEERELDLLSSLVSDDHADMTLCENGTWLSSEEQILLARLMDKDSAETDNTVELVPQVNYAALLAARLCSSPSSEALGDNMLLFPDFCLVLAAVLGVSSSQTAVSEASFAGAITERLECVVACACLKFSIASVLTVTLEQIHVREQGRLADRGRRQHVNALVWLTCGLIESTLLARPAVASVIENLFHSHILPLCVRYADAQPELVAGESVLERVGVDLMLSARPSRIGCARILKSLMCDVLSTDKVCEDEGILFFCLSNMGVYREPIVLRHSLIALIRLLMILHKSASTPHSVRRRWLKLLNVVLQDLNHCANRVKVQDTQAIEHYVHFLAELWPLLDDDGVDWCILHLAAILELLLRLLRESGASLEVERGCGVSDHGISSVVLHAIRNLCGIAWPRMIGARAGLILSAIAALYEERHGSSCACKDYCEDIGACLALVDATTCRSWIEQFGSDTLIASKILFPEMAASELEQPFG